MRKLMTSVSIRLVLGFWFIVSLFVFGNIPAVKAENTLTVEGEWVVQSSWDNEAVGSKRFIARAGDGYEVSIPGTSGKIYYGTQSQIMHSETLSYEKLLKLYVVTDEIFRSVLQEVGGKLTQNMRIVLFPDGQSVEFAEDNISIKCDGQTGRLQSYGTEPFIHKSTWVRISSPSGKAETPAVASVESRGEFYFLTKDGRKVTGEEASKVSLEEGTKVVTGSDGHIKMTLPDNTTFTVGPNSDLVIDKFIYDPDNSPEKVIATMTKGVFRWVTGKVSGGAAVHKDPAQMKVNLPVVAVGIRGTDFEATVAPDGSGSVVLNFGQLEITEKKTGFTFILNAGEKITFGAGGSVSRPMKIS